MLTKICTKCAAEFPATLEHFYKNTSGKYGLTPRCKPCINIDNKLSHERRLKADPDRIRALANARSKKNYHKDIEKSRKRQREHQLSRRLDPVKGAAIKARKRADGAGLTSEEIQNIRNNQSNKCAICGDENPTDLDHCHKTGQVRWLLCKHCNRGLGAFKDNPELLRKAAKMLEDQHQADMPVPSVFD